jgi:hypothetical protein
MLLGSIEAPLGLNRFAYTNGDPVSSIDPFGLMKEELAPNDSYHSAFAKWYLKTRERWEPWDPDYFLELLKRASESESGGWYEPASKVAGYWGIAASIGEFSPTGEWTIGSNWRLYTSGWGGGSRGMVKTFEIGEAAHIAGLVGLGLGELTDAAGLVNYYRHGPDSPNSVSPGHAATNLAVGVAAIPFGLVGGIAAGGYFLIDSTYPGGMKEALIDSAIIQENGGMPIVPRF